MTASKYTQQYNTDNSKNMAASNYRAEHCLLNAR